MHQARQHLAHSDKSCQSGRVLQVRQSFHSSRVLQFMQSVAGQAESCRSGRELQVRQRVSGYLTLQTPSTKRTQPQCALCLMHCVCVQYACISYCTMPCTHYTIGCSRLQCPPKPIHPKQNDSALKACSACPMKGPYRNSQIIHEASEIYECCSLKYNAHQLLHIGCTNASTCTCARYI